MILNIFYDFLDCQWFLWFSRFDNFRDNAQWFLIFSMNLEIVYDFRDCQWFSIFSLISRFLTSFKILDDFQDFCWFLDLRCSTFWIVLRFWWALDWVLVMGNVRHHALCIHLWVSMRGNMLSFIHFCLHRDMIIYNTFTLLQ